MCKTCNFHRKSVIFVISDDGYTYVNVGIGHGCGSCACGGPSSCTSWIAVDQFDRSGLRSWLTALAGGIFIKWKPNGLIYEGIESDICIDCLRSIGPVNLILIYIDYYWKDAIGIRIY